MKKRLSIVLLTLLLAMIAQPLLALADPEVDNVARELMCQCGCNKVVVDCTCGTAEQIRQTIREQLDEGKAKEQILAYYVQEYGEKVLAAPTKQGFNLTAWIMPFAAIIGGGGGIFFILRTWVSRTRSVQEEQMPIEVAPVEETQYEEQLRRELEKFGED